MPLSRTPSPSSPRRAGRVRLAGLAATIAAALAATAVAHRGATLQAQGAGPAAPESTLTFARDVAPILYRNCATCHHTGGIGPFTVLDYDTVRSRAPKILEKVAGGHMPPWHAEAPRGTFSNDRRLTDAEKSTILRWIADGAKLGDPKALPPAPVFTSAWEIGEPDVVLSMPEEFDVPAKGTIEYQYFEVPTNFTEDKWVQAIEVRAGAREVVHHVLVFARTPRPAAPVTATPVANPAPTNGPTDGPTDGRSNGPASGPTNAAPSPRPKPVLVFDENQKTPEHQRTDTRNAPPKERGSLIVGAAPGTSVQRFPEGTALRVPAGAILTFQMHYTTHGHEMKDRTQIGFKFAKAPPAEQVYSTYFFNGQFELPAGARDVMVPSSVTFNEPVRIYGLLPHTHLRGTRWEYTLEKPDGTSEKILDVPRYDFNWQTYYMYARPLEVPAGSRIVSRAWYDNSAKNPNNPDPTIAVHWGDQTWEEMQFSGMLYSVPGRRPPQAPR